MANQQRPYERRARKMTNGEVSVREHIEKIFEEFKDRYDSERRADKEAFEDFKSGLDEKTKLAAAGYEQRLTAYPTVLDFNELKDKVTNEFGTAVGKAKAFAIGLGLIAVLISGAGVIFAILK